MGNGRSLQPSDFEGASLEQMRNWVHGGSGADGLHTAADGWQAEEQYMRALRERVADQMKQAGAVIQGQGGEAMQNAVSPVVLWTEVSADNAQAQGQRLQSQGEAFAKVQSSVPAKGEEQHPPEDNFLEQGWSALTGSKTDNEVATAHNEKLRQEAITAFQGYDNTSQTNVQSSAVFTPPPQAGQPAPVASHGAAGAAGGGSESAGQHASGHHAAAHGGAAGSGAHHAAGPAHHTGSAGSRAPSGTNPAGAAPVGHQPWQQGSLETPAAGGSGGGSGLVGGVLGGGASAGGAAGRGSGGASGGAGRGAAGSSGGSGASEGSGGSARGSAGSGRGALGAGGSSGSGGGAAEAEGGSGSANRKNAGSAAGAAGGAPGAGGRGDEDDEHYSPEFLKGDHGVFDDSLPKVAPPVLGQEREPDQY